MKIGFTYDLKSDYRRTSSSPKDALAEFDHKVTIERIIKAIESGGHEVVKIGNARNLLKKIDRLDVDIVFNLCEGLGNRNRESEVPVILDMYRIPYVGSDGLSLGVTLDKVVAKKAFLADGVPTPKYFVVDHLNGAFHLGSMKFPFIVKPRHEGSSKGISDDSICLNEEELRLQVKRITDVYRQSALIEEFIDGSEFTVLVIGNENPVALTPVQIGICGKLELGRLVYTSRRVTNTDIKYICPPVISKTLDRRLREVACSAYRAVECRDFGRVDFRVDLSGRPYVLEINPLPSLSVEDVFPLIAEAEGMTFDGLVVKIIDIGLVRNGINKKRRKS
jgi:D-alanine-D-alanine ligase